MHNIVPFTLDSFLIHICKVTKFEIAKSRYLSPIIRFSDAIKSELYLNVFKLFAGNLSILENLRKRFESRKGFLSGQPLALELQMILVRTFQAPALTFFNLNSELFVFLCIFIFTEFIIIFVESLIG